MAAKKKQAALDLMAGLVLEDGRRWAEAACDFQWRDAEAVLDPDGTPYHFLTRARGAAKTADLAGMAVAVMLTQAPVGARLYGLAADRDQGRLLIDSIAGYAERTPELRGALSIDSAKVTASRSGAVLEVLAADAASSYGLRPWVLIIDEVAQWLTTPQPRKLFEATTSAMGKVAGSRLVILTSAGDPAHWAHGVLEHAEADLLWRVHEVRGPAPWMDRERLEEQRRRLPASSFARLFENRWTAPEDRLTTVDDLQACVVLDGPLPPEPGKRYVIGLDIGTVADRSVAVVAHAEPVTRTADDGSEQTAGVRVVLDRIAVWAGSRQAPVQLSEVGDWVEFVAREYNGATVAYDPHQAVDLAQRLRRKGVRVEQFNFTAQSVGRLALMLFQLLRAHSLALPDDPGLLDELANVRLRETSPGTYRLDHDSDKHDDRAIALALAAQRLVERVPGGSPGVAGVVHHGSFRATAEERDFDRRSGDEYEHEQARVAERSRAASEYEPEPELEREERPESLLGPHERAALKPPVGVCQFCGGSRDDGRTLIGRNSDTCHRCMNPARRTVEA